MEEYLPFVSIHTWTVIMAWGNLLILFLLLKHFLFKPIKRILDEREKEIENVYKSAEDAENSARNLKTEYEARLQSADAEADGIIKAAVEKASRRSEDIVSEADEKARQLMERSRRQIERDKKQAVEDARDDIAAMAVSAAEKLIGKRLEAEDDDKIISDIIDRI